MEAVEETRGSEPRKTNKKSTEEESEMKQPENSRHVRGRLRQSKESGGNAKGALRYEAETETWQCAQCEKKYAATDARGAAAHVAAHEKANQKKRRRQEQKAIRRNASHALMKRDYAPCRNMDKTNEEY